SSASVFLEESLRSFRSGSLTFAILHVTTAVELILKERLARIHPNLIFKNLDAETLDRSRTVGLRELPLRLSHLGVQISATEIETIREVSRWRNEIVHHTPTYDRKSALAKLGEIYNFLGFFLVHQLGLDLKSVISTDLYKTAGTLLDEWKNVVAEARLRASQVGQTVLQDACPRCGAERVLTEATDGAVECHLCGKTLRSGDCQICGKRALGDAMGWEDDEVYHGNALMTTARIGQRCRQRSVGASNLLANKSFDRPDPRRLGSASRVAAIEAAGLVRSVSFATRTEP